MTRAELRRQARAERKAKATYNMTAEQLAITARVAQADIMKPTFIIMLSLSIIALHDAFGFGPVRCLRFFKAVMLKWDIMHDDFERIGEEDVYDFKTFMKICKDEVGIDLDAELRKER